MQARWWILALAAIGTLWLLGCGQKKTEPQATGQTAAPGQPSGEAGESGESNETITPAASIAGIWAQIGEEQGKLATVVQNGQLKDVHHLAFDVRDLVVALAEKATASSPAIAPKLNPLVEQVKASAAKLDEMGDAGNLSGTQAELANLNSTLNMIKTVVNPT
jgi:hypothetical protein